MGVSGRCRVCETREARFRCEPCGALVCPAHYSEALGRCVECAAGEGGRRLSDAQKATKQDGIPDRSNR